MQTEETQTQEVELAQMNAPAEESSAEVQNAQVDTKEKIIFRGREFSSQAEATSYFEKLEDERNEMERARIEAEAYAQGIRDAQSRLPQNAPVAPPEENFEEQFYADPKGTLQKIEERATQRALQATQAETARERAWSSFAAEFPDLADSRAEVERILRENPYLMDIKDEAKAKKELAMKTRSYFQSIAERFAPTRELTQKKGQAVSAGSSMNTSVTPKQSDERPLTFVEQLRKNRMRG